MKHTDYKKTMSGKLVFPHCDGRGFIMSKYETEENAIRAYEDLKRFLICISQNSRYSITRELAPYREIAAKGTQKEYEERID